MIQNGQSVIKQKLVRFNQEAAERDAERRAARARKPYLRLITTPIEVEALALIPEARARELKMATVNLINRDLVVAVFDWEWAGVKEEVKRLEEAGYKPDVFIVSEPGLAHAWSFYRYVKERGGEIIGQVELNRERTEYFQKTLRTVMELRTEVGKVNWQKTSVTEVLEILIGGALALEASDIHFEPVAVGGGVRMRLDGVMQEVMGGEGGIIMPKSFYRQVISRIKLLAGLKLNITNETQDGRFTIKLATGEVETRVAIAPAENGEVAVLRLLDPRVVKVGLRELGLREDDLEIVNENLKRPNGLLLNTGPTGSGKTTTLYAFLREVSSPENKVITVEDPIEYHLPGIEQTQVDEEAGYTFANGLRSIMRQDPDVILVGEIRDEETAAIAVNASLTGHLVFSTLHTNDAAGAIPRLIDLGMKPEIIGSALNLVIAQRLVRRICTACRRAQPLDDDLKEKLKKFEESLPERVRKRQSLAQIQERYQVGEERERGCQKCGGTGYKGRVGIFELMPVTDKIKKILEIGVTMIKIREQAIEEGMVTLQQDGIIKAIKGETTLEEVERMTGKLEWV